MPAIPSDSRLHNVWTGANYGTSDRVCDECAVWRLAAQRYPKIIVSKSEQPKMTNTHTQNEGGFFSAKGAGRFFEFLE